MPLIVGLGSAVPWSAVVCRGLPWFAVPGPLRLPDRLSLSAVRCGECRALRVGHPAAGARSARATLRDLPLESAEKTA
ncbi:MULTISPECIES: hypothetical protein [unclassified Streptomyces]|uniref:hypothetical protein n=1 Tax=unclassified Streptomyces TaxID=2593676 RepID=UPI002E2D7177|nr:hypothetical protein [Streptomyces sp. NBC_00223]